MQTQTQSPRTEDQRQRLENWAKTMDIIETSKK